MTNWQSHLATLSPLQADRAEKGRKAAQEAERRDSRRYVQIGDSLVTFATAWDRARHFGLRKPTLPAMDWDTAERFRSAAFDYYYAPQPRTLDLSKRLRTDMMQAIEAAYAEHCGSRLPRKSRRERIGAILAERDGEGCWVCGHELRDDWTFEHKVARANGGTWAIDNLARAHPECNRALARLPIHAKEAARRALAPIKGDA